MATSIHNVLAVNLQNINDLTAVGNRTYTATRALRVFDLVARAYTTNAGIGVPTVSNGANAIITTTLPGAGSVANTLYRAGGNVGGQLVTTCDDAQMLVAAAGTLVFDTGVAGSNYDLTAFCITE